MHMSIIFSLGLYICCTKFIHGFITVREWKNIKNYRLPPLLWLSGLRASLSYLGFFLILYNTPGTVYYRISHRVYMSYCTCCTVPTYSMCTNMQRKCTKKPLQIQKTTNQKKNILMHTIIKHRQNSRNSIAQTKIIK